MKQSNVPAAARRQINAANREIKQLQEGKHPTQLQAAPHAAGTTTGGAPAAPPTVAIQQPPNFVSIGAAAPPGAMPFDPNAAAPAPASAEPPPGAQPVQPAEDFEAKYKVLQGKYSAETRRARDQINQLQQTVNTLQTRPAPPAPAPAPVAPTTDEQRFEAAGLTKAEVEEYGPELVKMIMRVAGNIAAPEIRRLADQQRQLSGQVTQSVAVAARTARELLWDALQTQVPDWELVNVSQEFLDWLNQVDIISGMTRQAGLMNAFEANDAMRVIGIFKTFKAEDERAHQLQRTRQVDPATLIAPGQPAQGATPAPPGDNGGRMIPEQEVREFFADVRRGRVKGKEREAREAEINLALVQGRIIPEHSDAHLLNSR